MEDTKNISSEDVQAALKGISFPAKKQDLIDQANDNGARTEVLSALQSVEDKEYHAVTEVQQAFSKTEA